MKLKSILKDICENKLFEAVTASILVLFEI